MGFNNINGPSGNQPIIQSAQNLGKDGGGGGNTGYMNMRDKKKKKQESDEDSSVFFEEGTDTFENSKDRDENAPSKGKKFLMALSKFMEKRRNKNKSNGNGGDSFEREDEEDKIQRYVEIEKENLKLTKEVIKHPPADDEYEIVDDDSDRDDGFYNIDV